jgi:hypothetical protein
MVITRELIESAGPCEGTSSVGFGTGFGLVIKVVVTEQSLWRIVSPVRTTFNSEEEYK